jgi:hypothetical protein
LFHIHHSGAKYLPDFVTAAAKIQKVTTKHVVAESLGCNMMSDVRVIRTVLQAACADFANAPAMPILLTVKGNQSYVMFGTEFPATFELPRDCKAISEVPEDDPYQIMSIPRLPKCADIVNKGCFTPNNNYDGKPNTTSGGAMSCRDENNNVKGIYCHFVKDKLVPPKKIEGVWTGERATGIWKLESPKPPKSFEEFNDGMECGRIAGIPCYPEIPVRHGSTCVVDKINVTYPVFCHKDLNVYCVVYGKDTVCKNANAK